MRNLKRALSLALASIMLLGMMVVGTSASYADVDAQDNLEAISVLQAVGIMSGDDKGNFNPDQKVTRTEMAVIMCNLLGLTVGGSHPFTDVPSWANGYVAACYNNGIIAGYSATKYGGNDSVTAVQASLMIMKALGYFGYAGEFGDSWILATVKQANEIDLYDGVSAYTDQEMTRNDIAQMVLNALECDVMVVREEGGLNVDGNGISVSQKPTYTKTPADNNSGKDYASRSGEKTMQLCEKLYGNDLKKNTETVDSFSRPATQWTYKDNVITTAKASTLTYLDEVKLGTIYSDLGLGSAIAKENVKFVTDGGTADDGQANDNSTNLADLGLTGSNQATKIGAKGTVTEVYYDRDAATDKVVIVMYNYYLAQATEDYDKDDKEVDVKIFDSINTTATLKAEDFAVSNVKKDDYLVVTIAGSTVKSVAPATTVENVVVSTARAKDYVTADGTKYTYNAAAVADSKTLGYSLMTANGYDINGDGYNLYLDPNGFVLGVKGYDAGVKLDDYVFIKDISSNGFDAIAKALFTDGTTKTITVSKVNDKDPDTTGDDDSVDEFKKGQDDNKFYTFELDSNGNYKLTDVASSISPAEVAQGSATDQDITASVNPIESNRTQYANNNTVFIAKDKVYTGVKNAPKITSVTSSAQNDVYYLYDKDNRLMLVYATKGGSVETSSENVVYILNNTPAVAKDGDTNYYIYDAIVNGEKTTLNANQNSKAAGLYKIDTYTDGRADLGTAISASANEFVVGTDDVTGLSYKDSVLSVTGGTAAGGYYLAEKATVVTVDGNTVKTVSADSLGAKTISDGFDSIILVKAKNEANADIIAVYLVK